MGKIDFHLITMTDQITHGYVKSSTMPIEKYFAIVYGLHTVDDRKSLWSQLKGMEMGSRDRRSSWEILIQSYVLKIELMKVQCWRLKLDILRISLLMQGCVN